MSEIINIKNPTLKTKITEDFIMFINQNKDTKEFKTCADYIKGFNNNNNNNNEKQIKRSTGYYIFKKLKIRNNESSETREVEPSEEESGNT